MERTRGSERTTPHLRRDRVHRPARRGTGRADRPRHDGGRTRPRSHGELANALGVGARVFDVDDADAVREALKDVDCLLNVADPFRNTAHPLMDACIEGGVHYLDTTAEFATFCAGGVQRRRSNPCRGHGDVRNRVGRGAERLPRPALRPPGPRCGEGHDRCA
ncbi:saccharopine dehydrogenase NADP-binding domain-containing protein [Actinophytocola algeriensis]|uniref:saccharopine dehydrogenase NADP-binding domain-containing protein n=1 Tax=Actinophytocola algeriensis TaxID=1768010 RepID=UPI001CEF0AEE